MYQKSPQTETVAPLPAGCPVWQRRAVYGTLRCDTLIKLSMNDSPTQRPTAWLPVFLLVVLFLIVTTQRAWMGDDAFITLRTVDNFVAGRGLVFNVGERVQSYTHPLWLLLISVFYAFTHEPYYTVVFLSLLVSLAAVLVLIRGLGIGRRGMILALTVLTLSGAFVDYSTSGLENALTHLLLVIFFAIFLRYPSSGRKLFRLSFVAALGVVNRMDIGLLFLPILIAEFFRTPAPWRRRLWLSAAGMLPFLLWELFSLVYYGFLVPNTAVAKLNIDVDPVNLWQQGGVYLLDSLRTDPITLLVIATGLLVAVWSREWRARLIAAGATLYLIYLVSIGGDFMSGRFLTAPLLSMVVVLAIQRLDDLPVSAFGLALAIMAAVGLLGQWPTLRPTEFVPMLVGDNLIVNERLYYVENNLIFANRQSTMPGHAFRFDGVERRLGGYRTAVWGPVGMRGYYSGPGVRIVDYFALVDPLVARLPTAHREVSRTGHLLRVIPEGYRETLETGQNQIVDPQLAEYYDRLSVVTRGPVWSLARWREIWRFNTGYYDGWLDETFFRFPQLVTVDQALVSTFRPMGTPVDAAGLTAFKVDGIEVALAAPSHAREVQVSLDGNTRYVVWFMRGDEVLARVWLDDTGRRFAGQLVLYPAAVPEAASRAGFDRVRIIPRLEQTQHVLGHLHLFGPAEWPGCGATECVVPLGDARAAVLLREGWAAPEEWGVWNDGPASSLGLYMAGGVNYRLVVRAFPAEGVCTQTVVVWLNGARVGETSFAGCGESELILELPGTLVRDGANELRFEYGATVMPGEATGDLRQLAVGFVELRLEPRGE